MRKPVRLTMVDRGYDFGPYPDSWLQIAWSHELSRGRVKTVRVLGRDLVLFRGKDGIARVLDAYCPHLGAHLGVGGTVVDNELRCPFHGWRFDGGGVCTHIPHATRIPARARVGTWTVREQDGLVLIWHDKQGRPPWFEIPRVPELSSGDWTRPRHYAIPIHTRWRELVENSVDRAHFHALHEYPEPPILELVTDGPRFHMKSRVRWRRFGRQMDVTLDISSYGACFGVTRGKGEAPFLVIGCPTPIDEHEILQRMTVVVSKEIPLPLRAIVARLVIFMAMREFRRDIPIWENKMHVARPVLSEVDGPIVRFRTWTRQFYGEPLQSGTASGPTQQTS